MYDLNMITHLLLRIFLHSRKCKLAVRVNISDLICRNKKMYEPINYNPHFLLLQDYFPAVANWLKLRSYTCRHRLDRQPVDKRIDLV